MTLRLRSLLSLLSLSFALSAHAGDKTIVVGQAIDLSGPNGSIGRDYVAGITTYFDSINTRGGINGKRIQFIARDDHGDPAESAKLVTDLLRQDHAEYMIGGIGVEATKAVVAAPAFVESHQVLFAPLSDTFTTSRAQVLFWRPSVEQEYLFILSYFEKLGIKNIGIAYQESALNRKAYNFVLEEMRRRGMTLAGTANVTASVADSERDALALSRRGAKLVITIADTFGSAQFLKAFRRTDPSTFVAGTSLINLGTLAEIAGARATEWTVFSQVVPNPSSTASALQNEHIEMMKKFRDEAVSSVTLEGFAVGKTLVKAIQLGGPGRGGLQNFASNHQAMDLGGLMILSAGKANNLSGYVALALFKKGGGLMF